ncbi:DnaJ domain-containing protein [Lutibacter sp. B2]|nr:DnaJ domain-containing protein [Lutibacter sp. B2]
MNFGNGLNRNIDYKSIRDIRQVSKWFVYNDNIASDFLKVYSVDKIENLAKDIYMSIKEINTQRDFLQYLLEVTAFLDLTLISYGELYRKHKVKWDNHCFESIPKADYNEFFNLKMMETLISTKVRILGWIYNKTFNIVFNPDDYKDEIKEIIENLSKKSNSYTNDFDYNKEESVKDYYEILEVHRKASTEVINRAYKTLAKKYHPDLNPTNVEYANTKMSEINEAYDVLSNISKRESYNKIYDDMIFSNLNKNHYTQTSNKVDRESEKDVNDQYSNVNEYEKHQNNNIDNKAFIMDNDAFKRMFIVISLIIVVFIFIIIGNYGNNEDINDANILDNQETAISSSNDKTAAPNYASQNYLAHTNGYTDYTDKFSNEVVLFGVITIDKLNVRKGPKTNYSKVAILTKKDTAIVLGKINDWYDVYIISNNYEGYGWVYGKYLDTYWYNSNTEKNTHHITNKSYIKTNNTIENTTKNTTTEKQNMIEKKEWDTVDKKITIGTTKEEVSEIMGTPDTIYESLNSWSYAGDSIDFDRSNKVSSWSNSCGNLKVELGKKIETNKKITIGTTKKEVSEIMGTPDTIYESLNSWSYAGDSIDFDRSNKVSSWSNSCGNLKVELGKKIDTNKKITIGTTKEEVLEIMGTPDTIYESLNSWSYDGDSINFDRNDKVSSWSNSFGNLKIK